MNWKPYRLTDKEFDESMKEIRAESKQQWLDECLPILIGGYY